MDHQKAMYQKEGALKRCKYTSTMDRWQNDEVYRESQLVHGWTEEWLKCFDYISRLISVVMHLTDSDYDMKAQSTCEASNPTNKQDHCVNDLIKNHQQMHLSAFN